MKFLVCINRRIVIFTLPWKVQQRGKIGNAFFDKQGGKLKFQKHNCCKHVFIVTVPPKPTKPKRLYESHNFNTNCYVTIVMDELIISKAVLGILVLVAKRKHEVVITLYFE